MNRSLRISFLLVAAAALRLQPAAAGPLDTLEFGGQVRVRGESRNPGVNYSAAEATDGVFLRTRLHVSGRPAEGLRAYVELQDSRTAGSEASVAANSQNVDLKEGYLDVESLWSQPLSLRAGRWALQYGGQRLISSLDWHNVGRSWDGARLRYESGGVRADLFGAILSESGRTSRRDDVLSGLYLSFDGVPEHVLDAYVLSRTSDAVNAADLKRHTAGLRAVRGEGPWTYAAEAAWQFGREAGRKVRAWGGVVESAYAFDLPLRPKAAVEYAYASGDKDPSDGDNERFNPLFPFGHFYHGFADLALWSNIHAFKGALSGKTAGGLWGEVAVHHFRLARKKDAWLGANGAAIASDASGVSGRDVGTEIDVHVKAKVRGALKLWGGYSHFFRGSYARRVLPGGGADMDWVFLQAVLNF